jgi:hypothetical protein
MPESVSNLVVERARLISPISASRPTKLVSGCGRLLGGAFFCATALRDVYAVNLAAEATEQVDV